MQVPYLRRIWEDVKKRKSYTMKVEEGIDRVRRSPDSSPFAFVMESAMVSNSVFLTTLSLPLSV